MLDLPLSPSRAKTSVPPTSIKLYFQNPATVKGNLDSVPLGFSNSAKFFGAMKPRRPVSKGSRLVDYG